MGTNLCGVRTVEMIYNLEIYFLVSYYLYNYWDQFDQLLGNKSSEIILFY